MYNFVMTPKQNKLYEFLTVVVTKTEIVRPINLCGKTKERTMSNSNLGQIEQWED